MVVVVAMYAPTNSGRRFSLNAVSPSFASLDRKSFSMSSRSSARPSSRVSCMPSYTARLISAIASGGPAASFSTCERSSSSVAKTPLTIPRRCASSGSTCRPVSSSSSAGPWPMIRGRRWVPPFPGSSPSVTSGVPSL